MTAPEPPFVPPGSTPPIGGGAVRLVRHKQTIAKVVALVVVAIVIVGAGFVLGMDEPRRAKVGDCLAGTTAEDLEVVKCSDAKAAFRVVGKIDKITREDWDGRENACEAYPTAESSFWEGKKGEVGYALCLEPVPE